MENKFRNTTDVTPVGDSIDTRMYIISNYLPAQP